MNARMATEDPSAALSGFVAAGARLEALDFAVPAPQVGDHAPDFALPDQRGAEVILSALLRKGPVVLIGGPGATRSAIELRLGLPDTRREVRSARPRGWPSQ
jgi:hypothetical protein